MRAASVWKDFLKKQLLMLIEVLGSLMPVLFPSTHTQLLSWGF